MKLCLMIRDFEKYIKKITFGNSHLWKSHKTTVLLYLSHSKYFFRERAQTFSYAPIRFVLQKFYIWIIDQILI